MSESYEKHYSRIIPLLNGFVIMLNRGCYFSLSQALIHKKWENTTCERFVSHLNAFI